MKHKNFRQDKTGNFDAFRENFLLMDLYFIRQLTRY